MMMGMVNIHFTFYHGKLKGGLEVKNQITAKMAKELTQKNVEALAKEKYLPTIYQKITQAADECTFFITDPFVGFPDGCNPASPEIIQELILQLKIDGFSVTQENCGEEYYTKISWEK